MYICICNAVTESQVQKAAEQGASSLEDLQMDLGVATCCGQCADDACTALEGARKRTITTTQLAGRV